MSGPALKKVDSHSSIHEAAIGEAEHLTKLLRVFQVRGEREKAYETACIILEHWETRTLAHAESEEEGLYREIVKERPECKEKITELCRDHTLMRRLAGQIRQLLAQEEVSGEVVTRFQAMILIDLIHNQEELQLVEMLGGRR